MFKNNICGIINMMFMGLMFSLGLCLGSCATCLLHRLHFDEAGFIKGRSHCPACKTKLSWRELIPVLSYIYQKGHCRHCDAKISAFYPITELVFALVFLLFASAEIWLLLIVFCLLLLFFQDVRYMEVDRRIAWPAIFIALIWCCFQENPENFLLGGMVGFSFYALQYFVSHKKWVGQGDLDLGLLMGLLLGWPQILLGLFLAYILGLVYTLPLLILKKLSLKSAVPMGAFLIPATLIMLRWGSEIQSWYYSQLF